MRWLAVVGVAVLAVACGTEGTPIDRAYVEPVRESVVGQEDPNALELDTADAGCVAAGIVSSVGGERLEELGFSAEDGEPPAWEAVETQLTSGELDTAVRVLDQCVDFQVVVAEILRGEGVDDGVAACMSRRYIDTGLLHTSLRSTEPDPALNERIAAAFQQAEEACSSDDGDE